MQRLIAEFLARGGAIIQCRPGVAKSRLVWFAASHPTRSIPLSLGIVGRW